MLPRLTVINRYDLKSGADAFRAAIADLARRVESQGEKGVLAYRFYVQEGGLSAQAVIDYATPEAWIGHHDIAMGWPEMGALHSVASLAEVTFLGEVTAEILAWLAGSSLKVQPASGFEFAAGFIRSSSTP